MLSEFHTAIIHAVHCDIAAKAAHDNSVLVTHKVSSTAFSLTVVQGRKSLTVGDLHHLDLNAFRFQSNEIPDWNFLNPDGYKNLISELESIVLVGVWKAPISLFSTTRDNEVIVLTHNNVPFMKLEYSDPYF